jgi:hypothetical protein
LRRVDPDAQAVSTLGSDAGGRDLRRSDCSPKTERREEFSDRCGPEPPVADLAIAIEIAESGIAVGATSFGFFQIREPRPPPHRYRSNLRAVVHGDGVPISDSAYGHGFGAMGVVILEGMASRDPEANREAPTSMADAGWSSADRAAYRRFVRTRHPDVGGDPVAFREGLARYAAARRAGTPASDVVLDRFDGPVRFVATPRGWRRAVRVLRPRRRTRRLQ